MYNIYKVIEIIKGINFDGVINKLEATCLQSWVNKNRNLSYEPRQVKLISLIDKVLEDLIITNGEREMLLQYCNKYASDLRSDISKIHELEGIICDNEISSNGIYHLQEWMNKNVEMALAHKLPTVIDNMINEILANGGITDEEQRDLKEMLSAHTNYIYFETKIEYLRKCVREKVNIGIDLINLLDDENTIGEIHSRAENELKKTLNTYSFTYVSDPEIVFISLVLIAMLHYNGAFYEYVRLIYKELYNIFSEQKIEGLIRTILNRYRSVDEKDGTKSRIINIALANTIVPSYYLKSFFEFVYDIYKINFDCDISITLYEEFKFVYEGLRNSMLSDGDDVHLNVTKKTYKLIKSTKALLVNLKNIDAVVKLSIIVVRLIDKGIWNKEVKVYNPYLRKGYEGWITTIKQERGITRPRNTSEFRSRWEPKFTLDGNRIFIVPPIHRIKAQYDYRDISIVVKNRTETIYANQAPDIREIIGGYQISVDKIPLIKPLGEVSYFLLEGTEIIYESNTNLYRKQLVFDEQGVEIHNNSDFSGTVIFCTIETIPKVNVFYKSVEYILASAHVCLGAAFLINDTVFNFSSLIRPGIMGKKYENHYLLSNGLDKQIPVFEDPPILVYESENMTGQFNIQINNISHRLSDFQHTITERESVHKYVVNLDGLNSGIYAIEVFSLEKGKRLRILDSCFAIDKKLEVETEKDTSDSYIVEIKSSLINESIVDGICISDFKEDWLKFEWRGQKYTYYIPFDFKLYRLNGGKWNSFEKEMWIGDITQDSILDIYGIDYDGICLLTNDGQLIDETPLLKNKGVFSQTRVGFMVSYKTSYDYVVVSLLMQGKVREEIYCYNKCILDEEKTEIVYNHRTKCLDICPRFYGGGKLYFKVTEPSGEIIHQSTILENNMGQSVHNLHSFTNYTISFCEKERGLSLRKERNLKEYNIVFYAREDFVERVFKIREVYYDQSVKGEFLRKKHYFNTTYLYFSEMIDDDLFVGKVYVKTYKGMFMLNNINPVDIEICSDVIDGIIELAITKDGDGLLLDFDHHGIMNSINDISAVDIFSYSIEMKGDQLH